MLTGPTLIEEVAAAIREVGNAEVVPRFRSLATLQPYPYAAQRTVRGPLKGLDTGDPALTPGRDTRERRATPTATRAPLAACWPRDLT